MRAKSGQTAVQLVRLRNSKRDDLHRFTRVPKSPPVRALYAPYEGIWCPYADDTLLRTLSPENPIYEHTDCQLFVAVRDGVDCGRVAAFHNPLSSLTIEQKLGVFGFFEAADHEVARVLLLDGAWPWLRGLGLRGMVGNVNPTTNDEVGVLVQGFHRHTFMLEFNPPEYPAFLEALGFRKAKDVFSFVAPLRPDRFADLLSGKSSPADIERICGLMARRAGISLEYLDKRDVAGAAREFCAVYNRAWRGHWGFEPMTSAELLYLAKDLLLLLPRDLVIFARDREGRLVGGALCAPDLNEVFRDFDGRMGLREMLYAVAALWAPRWFPLKRRPSTLRIIALGVLPEHESRVVNAYRRGFKEANISWVLEDNDAMLAFPRRLGLEPDQVWRFYQYRPDEDPSGQE